jgi:hypothetical protein
MTVLSSCTQINEDIYFWRALSRNSHDLPLDDNNTRASKEFLCLYFLTTVSWRMRVICVYTKRSDGNVGVRVIYRKIWY